MVFLTLSTGSVNLIKIVDFEFINSESTKESVVLSPAAMKNVFFNFLKCWQKNTLKVHSINSSVFSTKVSGFDGLSSKIQFKIVL